MKQFKVEEIPNIVDNIRDYFKVQSYESNIIKWCEENINFSDEISAQRDRLDFNQYPYQIEPLKACADLNKRRIVTVCFPEQMRVTPKGDF